MTATRQIDYTAPYLIETPEGMCAENCMCTLWPDVLEQLRRAEARVRGLPGSAAAACVAAVKACVENDARAALLEATDALMCLRAVIREPATQWLYEDAHLRPSFVFEAGEILAQARAALLVIVVAEDDRLAEAGTVRQESFCA